MEISTLQKQINNLRGKYIKQILERLESQTIITQQQRKVILDGCNDMIRDILLLFGDSKNE